MLPLTLHLSPALNTLSVLKTAVKLGGGKVGEASTSPCIEQVQLGKQKG